MKPSEPRSGHPNDLECGVCGGDGRLENAWGQVSRCPSCHGSGRRAEITGFHDVTKTKPSHHQASNRAGTAAPKQTWPSTPVGAQLANEIKASSLADAVKEKLTREIIEHEASHGMPTKTFLKKIRKQFRPAGS